MSESAGGVEIAVRAFPNENGNIPDIGKPFGLRVTSKDGSAVGKIIVTSKQKHYFFNFLQLEETIKEYCQQYTSVRVKILCLCCRSVSLMMV